MNVPPEVASGAELVPSLGWALFRMLGAVGLLGLAAWVLLRWRRRGEQGRRSLRVLERLALTRNASLALVSVAGKRLLLGISSDGVRLVTDVDRDEVRGSAHAFERVLGDVADDGEAA